MVNATRCLVAAAVIAALAPAAALAEPVIDVTTAGTLTGPDVSPGNSLGFSFTVGSSAISVVALDAFLDGPSSAVVRLYDGSANILATATVLKTDPTEGDKVIFNSHTLGTAVTLKANTTYYIVEDVVNNYYYRKATITADPSITYIGNVSGATGGTPFADQDMMNNPAYFGPDFDIAGASPSVVPEPSSIVLCGTALVGLAGYRLRRARRLAA